MVLGTVALVGAGAALSLERQRGAGAVHTLWAEDGRIFLTDALNRPALDALVRTYNGYLHVAPRLIASLVVLLPIRYAAIAMSGAGAVGAAAMAAVGYYASAPHIRSRLVRLVLAAFVVLLPAAAREVANNAANLHWYLIYAGFWVLLWNTRRTFDLALSAIVLALAALSDPLSVLLLPALALRLAVVRDRRSLVPPGVFSVALLLQLIAVVTHRSGRFVHYHMTWARSLLNFVRTALSQAFVERPGWGTNPRHIVVGWLVLAILLGAVSVTSLRRPHRVPLLGLLLAMTFVTYLVPVRISGYSVPRYWVLPAWFAAATLGVCVDEWLKGAWTGRDRLRIAAGVALVGVAAAILALSFPASGARAKGPTWEAGLALARARCNAGARVVGVPIPPGRTGRHWRVILPCSRA